MTTHSVELAGLRDRPHRVVFVEELDTLTIGGDEPLPQWVVLRAADGLKPMVTLTPEAKEAGGWIVEVNISALIQRFGACLWTVLIRPHPVDPQVDVQAKHDIYRAASPQQSAVQMDSKVLASIAVIHKLRRTAINAVVAMSVFVGGVALSIMAHSWRSSSGGIRALGTVLVALGLIAVVGRFALRRSLIAWRHGLLICTMLMGGVAPLSAKLVIGRQKIFLAAEHTVAIRDFGRPHQARLAQESETKDALAQLGASGMAAVPPRRLSRCEPDIANPEFESSDLVVVCRDRWLEFSANSDIARFLHLSLVHDRCLDLTGPRCDEPLLGPTGEFMREIEVGSTEWPHSPSDERRTDFPSVQTSLRVIDIHQARQTLVRDYEREYHVSIYGSAPIRGLETRGVEPSMRWTITSGTSPLPVSRMRLRLASRETPLLYVTMEHRDSVSVRCESIDETFIDLLSVNPEVLAGFAVDGGDFVPIRGGQFVAPMCRAALRGEDRVELALYLRSASLTELTRSSPTQIALQRMVFPPYVSRIVIHPATTSTPVEEPNAAIDCVVASEFVRIASIARPSFTLPNTQWSWFSSADPAEQVPVNQPLFWACDELEAASRQGQLRAITNTGRVVRWDVVRDGAIEHPLSIVASENSDQPQGAAH